jgi:hypothetical protein
VSPSYQTLRRLLPNLPIPLDCAADSGSAMRERDAEGGGESGEGVALFYTSWQAHGRSAGSAAAATHRYAMN